MTSFLANVKSVRSLGYLLLIIAVAICSTYLVSAIDSTQILSTNVSLVYAGFNTTNTADGVVYRATVLQRLLVVSKSPDSGAQTCMVIENSTGVILSQQNFVGNDCAVNISLSAGVAYRIAANSSGTVQIVYGTAVIPVNYSVGNFTYGCSDGGCATAGFTTFYNIQNITISSSLTPVLVNLFSPNNSDNIVTSSINFTANSSTIASTLKNATLYIWNSNGTLYNSTNKTISGTYNSTTFSTSVIIGNYIWNVLTCNVNDTCVSDTNNRTFLYGVHVNSNLFNASTFETARENFVTNISLSNLSSLSLATLYYNGTAYTGTINNTSGNDYQLSVGLDIPLGTGTKNWYWMLTYANSIQQSLPTQNQIVNSTSLAICGAAPSNIPFINLTFKDETTLTAINATIESSNWQYYLGSGTVNQTLSFSNSSSNLAYAFCFTPPSRTVVTSISSLRYTNGVSYPQRIFNMAPTNLTNATNTQILYLLSSSNGVYMSLLVVQGLGTTPIVGASVTVTGTIAGNPVVVGSGTTDSAGIVTFWLNPNAVYAFDVTADGFVSQSFSLSPSQTIYTVRLQPIGTGTVPYNSSLSGYKWFALPQPGSLSIGPTQFSLNLTAYNNNLYSCRFTLLNESNLAILNQTTGGSSSGCYLTLYYNVTDDLNIFGSLEINNTLTNGTYQIVDTDWKWVTVEDVISTWTTITSFFQGFNDLSDFGATGNRQEFSKIMFFFLITTILLSLFTYLSGFELQNPGVAIFLLWFIVFMASVGGIFDFSSASGNVNEWIKKYGVLLIFSMFAIGQLFNALRRQS